jgi:hypothetical protein
VKINFLDVYKDRIKQIEVSIKKAIHDKKWTEVARLEAEKSRLKVFVNND